MNAAARLVSGTKKYDRGLTHLLHSERHWLDVSDRVTYKLGVTVYKCLHGQAPDYLSELCIHRSLKLLNDSIFVPPAVIYSLFHGFSLIRTAAVLSLSLDQRHGTCSNHNLHERDMQIDCFRRTLKTFVFEQYSAHLAH